METQNLNRKKSTAEKINSMLKKAQLEIEEFALQFALGKADATDKFEEIKKELLSKVRELKAMLAGIKATGKDKISILKSKLEELELQLALGKAETKSVFARQRSQILEIISELDSELKKSPSFQKYMDEFQNEMEKFKLKMEILKLKFELKKFEVKDSFRKEMSGVKIKIDKIFDKVEGKFGKAKEKYTDFSDEIDLAYKHLRKAVKSL